MVSAFSIPQAKRDEKLPDNPGPGQYNPENTPKLVKKKQPEYSIPKEKRDSPGKHQVPGPGSYEHEKSPSYGFRIKPKEHAEPSILGPGRYDPKIDAQKPKAPAYSMKPRSNSTMDNYVPGPGNYEPFKSSVVLEHAARFGQEKRTLDVDNRIPGPGSYNYQNAVNKYQKKNEPRYGFGAKPSEIKGLEVPGPGSYNSSLQGFSKIGGIMSRDLRLSMPKSESPGPGAYSFQADDKVKPKEPMYSLPRSRRDSMNNSFVPGPGQYDSPQSYQKVVQKSPNVKFGSDKRLKEPSPEVPGPGSYNYDESLSKKKVYIGIKTKDPDGLTTPGPGAYEANYKSGMSKSQMYSVGKSSRNYIFDNSVPGPGAYGAKGSFQGPKIGFGIDKKLKQEKSAVPGPGAYELKPMFADVPKYLLPNKS